jgi:hypothetical protein
MMMDDSKRQEDDDRTSDSISAAPSDDENRNNRNALNANNQSPVPSVGPRAASLMFARGEADENDVWRTKAAEWYAMGLGDTPGAGRLQHHLGSLSRDAVLHDEALGRSEELRAAYHFTRR